MSSMYIGKWVEDIELHGEVVDTEWHELYVRDGQVVKVTDNWDGDHWSSNLDDLYSIAYNCYKLRRQQGDHEESYLLGIYNDYGFASDDAKLAITKVLADKINDILRSCPSKTWQDVCYEHGVTENLVAWAFV